MVEEVLMDRAQHGRDERKEVEGEREGERDR